MDLPTRAEIVNRYSEITGADMSAIAWYEAFGCWKTAIVVAQLYNRHCGARLTMRDKQRVSASCRLPAVPAQSRPAHDRGHDPAGWADRAGDGRTRGLGRVIAEGCARVGAVIVVGRTFRGVSGIRISTGLCHIHWSVSLRFVGMGGRRTCCSAGERSGGGGGDADRVVATPVDDAARG